MQKTLLGLHKTRPRQVGKLDVLFLETGHALCPFANFHSELPICRSASRCLTWLAPASSTRPSPTAGRSSSEPAALALRSSCCSVAGLPRSCFAYKLARQPYFLERMTKDVHNRLADNPLSCPFASASQCNGPGAVGAQGERPHMQHMLG